MSRVSARARTTAAHNLFLPVSLIAMGTLWVMKSLGVPQIFVTMVCAAGMIAYTAALRTKTFRLNDERSGDNIYYLGFLLTLTSLAMSLYQFAGGRDVDPLITDFGIAITTTILGVLLRVWINQTDTNIESLEIQAREDIAQAAVTVADQFRSITVDMARLREEVTKTIDEAVRSTGEATREALAKQAEQAAESWATLTRESQDEFRQIARGVAGSTEELVSHTKQVCEQAHESLLQHQKDAIENLKRIQQAAKKATKGIDTLSERMEEMPSPSEALQSALASIFAAYSEAVEKMSGIVEQTAKTLAKTEGAITELAKQVETATAHQKGINATLPEIQEMAQSTGRDLHDVLQRLSKEVTHVQEKISALGESCSGSAQKMNAELERQLAALQESNKKIQDELITSQNSFNRVHEGLTQATDKLVERIDAS